MGCSLIFRTNVFLNSTLVESNNYRGIWSYLTDSLLMTNEERQSLGKLNYFRDSEIGKTINANYFDDDQLSKDEKRIMKACRNVVHTYYPLNLDIATADT